MRRLWRLAIAAALVAYGVAVLGSWVRINGAGMTCPDWPLCNGSLFPPLAHGVVWEWSHRLLVVFEAPLVAAVIVTAWPQRPREPLIRPTIWLVGSLFALQIALGAATVHLSNNPISVVVHWGTAMAFLASLIALAIFARSAHTAAPGIHRPAGSPVLAVLSGTSAIAFLTMCIGAFVSSSGAGLACQSIPGCAGSVVMFGTGQYVQMLHRLVGATCLLMAAASFALSWKASQRVRWLTALGLTLIFGQVLLGLANVAFSLPVALREAHAANAAAAFIVFVIATTFAALESGALRLGLPAR